MKKLILVTLTAFAASWLLAEFRRETLLPPPSNVAEVRKAPRVFIHEKHTPDGHASIPIAEWNRSDSARPASAKAPSKSTAPSWFPKTELEEESQAQTDEFGFRVIVGRVSASEERAKQDLRQAVERAVTDWLAADVATSWKVPAKTLDSMVEASYTQEVTRNLIEPGVETQKLQPSGVDGLFTLYRAGQKLDFSPGRRAQIIGTYRKDLATKRMQRLGGGLALALATLAVLSGYIKTDEATKGYYTNRLRFLAAAGLGAAGVVVYRLWA